MSTALPRHDAGDDLLIERRGSALIVTFNRPRARNAMTDAMYQGLVTVCEHIDADPEIRALGLIGAGDRAFVAGTDISQFRGFTGEDGIAYEQRIGQVLSRLLAVQVPVVAAVRGHCVGGGLGIASCADIRLASADASFAVPIASTLGNTLSGAALARLRELLGESRVARMLLTARPILAEEAAASGFATLVEDPEIALHETLDRITELAPLTLWSIKEQLRRLRAPGPGADDADIIARIYGSEDFAGAVAAFLDKTEWTWRGR